MTFGIQKLKGGAVVNIGTTPDKCSKCGQTIYWAMTKNKKLMPVCFVDGEWQSHFADCKFADSFRKPKTSYGVKELGDNAFIKENKGQ